MLPVLPFGVRIGRANMGKRKKLLVEVVRAIFTVINTVAFALLLFFASLGFSGLTDAGPNSDRTFGVACLAVSMVPLGNAIALLSMPSKKRNLLLFAYAGNSVALVLGLCFLLIRPGIVGGFLGVASVWSYAVANVVVIAVIRRYRR